MFYLGGRQFLLLPLNKHILARKTNHIKVWTLSLLKTHDLLCFRRKTTFFNKSKNQKNTVIVSIKKYKKQNVPKIFLFITFFLFSPSSISISVVPSHLIQTIEFSEWQRLWVLGWWCSLCAYKKWGRLCVLPLNGHIFLLCYLRWMEEKSGHSFIIEVWSSQSGSFVSCYLMALVGWSKKSRGNHFQSRFMRTSFF